MGKVGDSIFQFIEKLTKRKWTDTDINNFIGSYKKTYAGFSSDSEIRENAASGGVITQILKTALENNEIDGALVCKSVILEGNKVRAKLYIAENYEELLESQGSKYVLVNYMSEAISLINDFNGKIGIVGLPCEISSLKRKAKNDIELSDKIVFTISLFCGHASDTALIDSVTKKLLKKEISPIKNYSFRKGHWRGKLRAELSNGTIIEKSAFYFNQYQNLYFHCSRKCLACKDHFGYDADINIGDIWLYEFKNHPIKHNAIITKTELGDQIITSLNERKSLELNEVKIEKILDAQSRSIVLHYNVSSRSKAGRKFGMKIPDNMNLKTKWHQDVLAWLIIYNYRWSKSDKYDRIFKLPKPIIKIYLYFFKFLESL